MSQDAVKPCIKCGASERSKKGDCKACARITSIAYRAANKDKIKAYWISYRDRDENKEKMANAKRLWKKKNKERLKIHYSNYRKNNQDVVRAGYARYLSLNASHVRNRVSKWRKENKDLMVLYRQNRRARTMGSGGMLSKGLKDRLFKLQKGKCACCRKPIGANYHMDHIMPLYLGGTNTDDNIQLLRATCNMQKHTKHPVDFMQSRGFLL